jgi:acyl-CoA reductase-like NAD-dependent aldehyde dehydrogenase
MSPLGPSASIKQYKRVQEYIKSGIEEGAELVIGGEGHPSGLEDGNFVRPTVFANVTQRHADREGRDLWTGLVDIDVQDGSRSH